MAIPTVGLMLDINPALMTEPDGVLATLVAGGRTWEPYSEAVASLALDANGVRHLSVPVGGFTSNTPPGPMDSTFLYLHRLEDGAADTDSTTIGINAAVFNMSMSAVGTWSVNTDGAPIQVTNPPTQPVVIAGSVASDGTIVIYGQGAEAGRHVGSPYFGAESPGFIPRGLTYRVLWYDRVLTPAEVASISAELLDDVTPKRTVTWDAPASTTDPIDGYLVRMASALGVVERTLEPAVRTIEAPVGATVLISARSARGTSSPVQLVVS